METGNQTTLLKFLRPPGSLSVKKENRCRKNVESPAGRKRARVTLERQGSTESAEKSSQQLDKEEDEPQTSASARTIATSGNSAASEIEETGRALASHTTRDFSDSDGQLIPDEEDGIESDSDDDDREMVAASSMRGQDALCKLKEAEKCNAGGQPSSRSKQPPRNQNEPKTGSLFACLLDEEKSCDMCSPKYDPSATDASCWHSRSAGSVLFEVLSTTFDTIEKVKNSGSGSKRSAAVLLANCFRFLILTEPNQLHKAVYFSLNKVAPEYLGVEVGVGEALILKAMAETYGRSESSIKKDLQQQEDLGKVAEASSCKMRTLFPAPRLTISGVFDELKAISMCSGKDSQQRKRDKIKKMLVGAKSSEAKYVIRFLQQRLRIGVQTATIYQALSFAAYLTKAGRPGREPVADLRRVEKKTPSDLESELTEMEQAVRAALCELPNMERIVQHLLEGCAAKALLQKCQLTPGVPVQPMLAKPTKGIQEVFDRFSNCTFTCEFKYDGERAQVHVLSPTDVRVFSRNLEDLTSKYPDIVEIVKSALQPDVTDCVLDSEVVAYDAETNRILPFQVLTTRKRKDVSLDEIKVPICLFPFDCMRHNGSVLLREPLQKRREYLRRSVASIPGQIQFATHREMSSVEDVDSFLQEAVEGCCEGLMVKTLEESASYEPMKRSLNWLKIKKDYVEGLTDSMDLVPLGAFYGKGKRSGVYGAFLLAAWNPETESFQTTCKAGTGFSDEILSTHYESLKEKVIATKKSYYDVAEKMQPDVWFEACQVWECRAADLSISPVHTAAYGERASNKGIGLRFPRFIRVREDKDPEQATTSDQIANMYDNQAHGNAIPSAADGPSDEE